MLEPFSGQSHAALQRARQESERLRHYYIGVEHLFLALCDTAAPPLREAIKTSGIEPVIERLRSEFAPAEEDALWGTGIIQTPRLNRVLQRAGRMCVRLKRPAVTPHLLLLAILAEPKSLPMRLCAQAHSNVAAFQRSLQSLAEHDVEAESPAAASANSVTPTLDRFGRDLTSLARMRKLDPLIGRDGEIERLSSILLKTKQNNILILGEAGTGKTHLVEGLALALAFPQTPAMTRLAKKRLIELDVNALVAGTAYRGEFESRLDAVLKEASDPDVILFIDEFHLVLRAGAVSSEQGAGQVLKPYLARGEIRCIGATTTDEYQQFIEADKAFERRFETVTLREPTSDETLAILKGLVGIYERSHHVRIEEDALHACVEYGARYFPTRRFPAKAIDLLDVACAQVSLGSSEGVTITRGDVGQVVFQRTGVVVTATGVKEFLAEVSGRLQQRIMGQPEVIDAVVTAVRNAKLGLTRGGRPQAVLLTCGPSGVGKTELARAVARELSQADEGLVLLKMGDFAERTAIASLIGAAPGYVGHEEGGQLTEAVRRNPFAVVLFDQIEQAHPDARRLVLQICEEGRLVDSHRRVVDFANTFVFITVNAGPEASGRMPLGFGSIGEPPVSDYERFSASVRARVEKVVGGDLLSRVDDVLVFRPLTATVLREIIDKEIADLHNRSGLRQRSIVLRLHDSAYDALIDGGYSQQHGARHLGRAIDRTILKPLGDYLASRDVPPHSVVVASVTERCTEFGPPEMVKA